MASTPRKKTPTRAASKTATARSAPAKARGAATPRARAAANGAGRRLVIVESPTKARTISRFLPSGYTVLPSIGHVRDLPQNAAEIPEQYRKAAWARSPRARAR